MANKEKYGPLLRRKPAAMRKQTHQLPKAGHSHKTAETKPKGSAPANRPSSTQQVRRQS